MQENMERPRALCWMTLYTWSLTQFLFPSDSWAALGFMQTSPKTITVLSGPAPPYLVSSTLNCPHPHCHHRTQSRFSFTACPAVFDMQANNRASLPAGFTQEGPVGVSRQMLALCQCWVHPARAPTHLVQLCISFKTNPKECPFYFDWLLVTS